MTKEILRSEETRTRLDQLVAETAGSGGVVEIGIPPGRAIYQLADPDLVEDEVRECAVRISVDRARKRWQDVRQTARLLGVAFAIGPEDGAWAILRRHPGYEPTLPDRWRAQWEDAREDAGARRPRTPSAGDWADDLAAWARGLEERVSKLEAETGAPGRKTRAAAGRRVVP